jgi:phosphomannomutase/phosphomannomutase/phosphoglucomutase
MFDPVIFREYDIRGVYNKQFDDDFAYQLGKSYCQYLKIEKGIVNPVVTLAHDARLSGPNIKIALSKGLQESGAKVIFLGLVTSPISYFSTFHVKDAAGGIMITGSHNPPEYNGFKISVGKTTIFGAEIQKLRKFIEAQDYTKGVGEESSWDILPTYLDRYHNEFGKLRSFPLVLDCGNGAAGCIVRKLFEGTGLLPKILFEEPDGKFPNHHPDPTVEENLVDLVREVKATNSVLGIGFDGDADRIGIVDHNGNMIYGDELMVLISRQLLNTNPNQKIIGDVKCSDRMYADIKKHGGQPIMWKTGHSLIKEKIKLEKSPFGGEMSGHIFFADRNYGYDDALYAALRLCEIISITGKNIPQLLEGLPKAFNTPEIRIDTTEEKKTLIVQKLIESFTEDRSNSFKLDFTDGIRVSFEDGWALARASNTQPVLVLRFESTTPEGLERIRARFEKIVNNYL